MCPGHAHRSFIHCTDMSFQLTLFTMLLLLIAVAVGHPIQSQSSDLKIPAVPDNSALSLEVLSDEPALYDYFEQPDPSFKNMEKRWANQVRFGKRASWASSVRFG